MKGYQQREFEFIKHCTGGWTLIIFTFGTTPGVRLYAFAIMRVTASLANVAIFPFDVSKVFVALLF